MSTYRCLQPEYVRHFQCDGASCDARCCRGWNIQLDTGALERFRNAPEKLSREIFSHVAANELTGAPEIVKVNGSCPMLGEDLLCSLQKRCGEGFIADVCAEYPRLTTQFPDRLERALCMTCPLVARLALFDESPMRFEETELTTERETYFQQADDAEAIATLHFFDLQKGGIRILQDRGISLPERMVKLESFLLQAEGMIARGQGENIPGLTDGDSGVWLEHGAGVFSARLPVTLRMLEYLLDKSEDDDPASREFLERISRVLLPEESAEHPDARWEACYAAYEREVLDGCGHILEHYFVNEYFSALYPCATEGNFRHNGRIFMALYCLLELFLVCLLAEKGRLTGEDFVLAVRWLAVRVKHFVGYIGLVSNFLLENENALLLERTPLV